MDEAQEALTQTKKFTVAKHKYESLDKAEGCMICFFEGVHDKDYYKTHIRTICGEIEDITCHCKANVLRMYDEIHATNKDKYRLAYFIDRDFDDLVNNPDIFETEGYAIENYYCSKEAFSRYMKDYLYLDGDSDDYQRAMNFYDSQFDACHNVVADFNYYYAALKRQEREGGPKCPVEAGDNFPQGLGSIEAKSFSKNYSLDTLNHTYGTNVNDGMINVEKLHLDTNKCLYFRGKYEIQALENILVYIIKEAAGQRQVDKPNRVLQKNPQVNCFQAGKLLLGLSPMADVTQGLRDYLNKFVSA